VGILALAEARAGRPNSPLGFHNMGRASGRILFGMLAGAEITSRERRQHINAGLRCAPHVNMTEARAYRPIACHIAT
jgi:hypothetical protein